MRIEIHYTKFQGTPNITAYVRKRLGFLEKALKRFEKREEVLVLVELARVTAHHKKGDVFYAEAVIEIPGKPMRATFTGSDIRVAITKVEAKLKRELRQDKGRILTRIKRGL
ncbi:HPF/RaiA family ribosome-associated protein [Patescibacteria group bacterium]|nr:HPF/RaiA family ribosome-associated protein [Patescibacteria group bacterium]